MYVSIKQFIYTCADIKIIIKLSATFVLNSTQENLNLFLQFIIKKFFYPNNNYNKYIYNK